jgi:hypothetical protein
VIVMSAEAAPSQIFVEWVILSARF